jgi:uncharacterized membrane protein
MPGETSANGSETAASARESIREVVRLEQESLAERSLGERISDRITGLIGRLGFVVLHAVVMLAWFAVNLGLLPGVRPFDPFPFGILTLIVSAEGVLLALFILISQNRMSRQADLRAHLTLQISLLAEKESTRMLQILETLSTRLGLAGPDEQAKELVTPTDVPRLARELKEKLPDD